MNMKNFWNTTTNLNLKNEKESYLSVLFTFSDDIHPRELKVSRSLVQLSNKIIYLEKKVAKLDKLIKENMI
jgi:hypothetical protein